LAEFSATSIANHQNSNPGIFPRPAIVRESEKKHEEKSIRKKIPLTLTFADLEK